MIKEWGMLCGNCDFVFYGRFGKHPSDCLQILVVPSGRAAAHQLTLFRNSGESDYDYWLRAQSVARTMVGVKPKRGTRVEFLCRYNVPHDAEEAERVDNYENYRRLLRWQMLYDPSEKIRIKAGMDFANLVYPQLRGTLQ